MWVAYAENESDIPLLESEEEECDNLSMESSGSSPSTHEIELHRVIKEKVFLAQK